MTFVTTGKLVRLLFERTSESILTPANSASEGQRRVASVIWYLVLYTCTYSTPSPSGQISGNSQLL